MFWIIVVAVILLAIIWFFGQKHEKSKREKLLL